MAKSIKAKLIHHHTVIDPDTGGELLVSIVKLETGGPRTPYEVYFDIPLDFDVRERVKKAIKQRVKNNKCADCKQCTMGCKKISKNKQSFLSTSKKLRK